MLSRFFHEAAPVSNAERADAQTVHPDPSASSSPTMSQADAARHIGVSVAWLRKSRTAKFREVMGGPAFVRCGPRRVVYLREDLDRWQQKHRTTLDDDQK